ncbi:hypothetical protein HYU14_02085 [Candidatus Woesearchaeota archaeon]|nr:hypothetical protein [Candidatus Woesearchaeota archaeon]
MAMKKFGKAGKKSSWLQLLRVFLSLFASFLLASSLLAYFLLAPSLSAIAASSPSSSSPPQSLSSPSPSSPSLSSSSPPSLSTPSPSSASSSVLIVNFNYDNGLISYKDRIIKCGFSPDYALQPEEGYRAELISVNNEVLYSFTFEIPLKVNVDLGDPVFKTLSGGMIILNRTDFALTFPGFDNAKSAVIYNPRKYKVLEVPLIEEQFIGKKGNWMWLLALILLLIIAYAAYRHYRNRDGEKR